MTTLGLLLGGLGLFLLGMGMMTNGLKLAAGPALHQILRGATRTRWHALGSGVLVTALVQSSSAVTVAAIGFVNAGLLGLAPALWVLFGANVGTTMTGWIVALVGLKFKVEALALPLVGVGVLLQLGGEGRQRAALGAALAGFGLLFLGIATLQQAFGGLAGQVSLPQGTGPLDVLAQLGIGVVMTVLMQSSSASMTIALTAAQSGLLDTRGAAAVVIGANIGTTVTALLAAVGATPNARRAASAHVVFNLLTGVIALALLPWLLEALGRAREALQLPSDPAAKLALFHTCFNLLGVLLMWPIADRLTRWLQQRFRGQENDAAQPRHLDDTVLAVPTLALDALRLEVMRVGQHTTRVLRSVLSGAPPSAQAADLAVVKGLDQAVEAFIERMNRASMSAQASARLAELLRIERYHEACAELAASAAPVLLPAGAGPALAQHHRDFLASCDALLPADTTEPAAAAPDAQEAALVSMETSYEALKASLLAAGAAGQVSLADMESALRRSSALRAASQRAAKAVRRMGLQ